MSMKTLKKEIQELAKKIGPKATIKVMMDQGVSYELARKFLGGTYHHKLFPDTEWKMKQALKEATNARKAHSV